jgi:hypothetical protein
MSYLVQLIASAFLAAQLGQPVKTELPKDLRFLQVLNPRVSRDDPDLLEDRLLWSHQALRKDLRILNERYPPDNESVIAIRKRIADVQRKLDELRSRPGGQGLNQIHHYILDFDTSRDAVELVLKPHLRKLSGGTYYLKSGSYGRFEGRAPASKRGCRLRITEPLQRLIG